MQNILTKHFSSATCYLFILGLLLILLSASGTVYAAEKTTPETEPLNEEVQVGENSPVDIEMIQQNLKALRMELENSKKNSSMKHSNITTIQDGLKLIENKLKGAYSGLDQSQTGISTNSKIINELNKELQTEARNIRANVSDLVIQKSLIEDNSIRLYEILLKISSVGEQIERFSTTLENVQNKSYVEEIKEDFAVNIHRLWGLLSIILVFFAPLAFVISNNRNQDNLLTDGIQQHQGVLLACLSVFLGYFGLGFGLMYGTSSSGLIGISNYLMADQNTLSELQANFPFIDFMLYQTGFAMLAAMIVYIAVGRQLSSVQHVMLALFVGAVLIPVFGHWVWGSHFVTDNKGWLEGIGFIDQGGAIVINAIAAWFAFVLVLKLRHSEPPPSQANEESDDPVYSTSAILVLWLSWLGFTAGNLPISDEQISSVMLNVGLSGSAGGLAAYLHYVFFQGNKSQIAHGLGGFVTGLVAIAACAQSVTFPEAIVIGASAGLLQNVAYDALRKSYLKQIWQKRAAYLIAIHGVGGIWGALCVALLGSGGTFSAPDILQFIIQLKGIAAALAYSFVMANIMLLLLKFSSKRSKSTA